MLFSFQIFGNFPDTFTLLVSNLSLLWSENTLSIIGIILSLLRFVLWPRIWIILVKYFLCTWKKVYSLLYGVLYKCQLDQVGRQCSKFLYLLLFIYSVNCWKMDMEVSSNKCGLVCFFPCSSFIFYFMFFENLLGAFRIVMSSWWIGLFIISLQSDPSLAMILFFVLLYDITIDSYCSFILASVRKIQPFTFNLLCLLIWDKFLTASM